MRGVVRQEPSRPSVPWKAEAPCLGCAEALWSVLHVLAGWYRNAPGFCMSK